jgi:flagellar M-ring protein FliF
MPRSGRLGFELFDKPNWAGSDFSEKVNYQRALEAELERTLETLSEVSAVRVHLVVPEPSLYSDRERTAKASVILKLRRGALAEQSDTAIRQLVAGAVDRLSPENVVVIDADTDQPMGRFGGSKNSAGTSELDQELEKKIVETLQPVVGSQGVRASVHVEYDLTSGEETQETYDPNSVVAVSMTRAEERLGSEAAGGVPGTSSNLPNAKLNLPANKDAENHSSKTESGTYAVNKVVRHTIQPAGRIKRITAALLVDDATDVEQKNGQRLIVRRKRTSDEMKQIEGLAAAALAIDQQRGDLLAVENLSFHNLQADGPAAPSAADRVQRILRNFAWIFRYGALACLFGVVYVMLLRPVKKQVMVILKNLPSRLAAKALPEVGIEAIGGIGAAAGSLEELSGIGADPALRKLANLKKHLSEKVKTEPAEASRLVQSWLREGGVE